MSHPLAQEPSIFLSASRGLCRACHEMVPVRYVSDGESVFLERRCPEHGVARAMVAESLAWFLEATETLPLGRPPVRALPRTSDCPGSCGPCTFHAQNCQLPVFSITNACDLECPICFTYNRPDRLFHMSAREMEELLDFVVEATGGVDLVNVTGGEPTLHPSLLELLALARRPGIGRITMNTNGRTLARKPELARALNELGVYVILSLDTLSPETSVTIHGRDLVEEKLQALDNLARYEVDTTLLMVLVGGVNESELDQLLELTLGRDHVRSLTIQTMTYTGAGGGAFLPRRHLPVDAVERRIEEATGGAIARSDFVSLPTAHPLCYGVTYLIADPSGAPHPLTRMLPRETLRRHLSQGYLLHPSDELEQELRDAIDRLWSEDREPELLRALKELLGRVYPPGETLSAADRQRRAEQQLKTIYVHAHMDEDTYEIGRAMRCPDQVPVSASRLIGACNYNLFYRQRDERFWKSR